MKSAVFTFGRFNPPTIGHEKLIQACEKEARKTNADVFIFASHKEDKKKDPLSWKDKVMFMKKAFPKYRKTINDDGRIINALQAASYIYDKGYRELTMVVGGDRVVDFALLLNTYNGEKKAHGFYDFEDGIQVESAGERDPDAVGVEGMSASKMRAAVVAGDVESFKTGVPAMSDSEKVKLYKAVEKGMGLNEMFLEGKKRNYKAEYKKFQSSTKMKKYRAELNKYNREKGTYGNGDGKDASHKNGKIVGFEKESKNRGRAEKSRLKGSKRARTFKQLRAEQKKRKKK